MSSLQLHSLLQLHKKHIVFLTNFTTEIVNFFAKMKHFYQEQEIKRKKIFQTYKNQVFQLVHKKVKEQQLNLKLKEKKIRKKQKKKQIIKLKKPKTPNSAYFMFFMDWKSQIKEDFPDQSMIDQAKMAGKLWKQLQESERQIYFNKYDQQKRIYDEQLRKYKQQKKKTQSKIEQKQQQCQQIQQEKVTSDYHKNSPNQKINEIQLSISLSEEDKYQKNEVIIGESKDEKKNQDNEDNDLMNQTQKLLSKIRDQSMKFEAEKKSVNQNKHQSYISSKKSDSLGQDSI